MSIFDTDLIFCMNLQTIITMYYYWLLKISNYWDLETMALLICDMWCFSNWLHNAISVLQSLSLLSIPITIVIIAIIIMITNHWAGWAWGGYPTAQRRRPSPVHAFHSSVLTHDTSEHTTMMMIIMIIMMTKHHILPLVWGTCEVCSEVRCLSWVFGGLMGSHSVLGTSGVKEGDSLTGLVRQGWWWWFAAREQDCLEDLYLYFHLYLCLYSLNICSMRARLFGGWRRRSWLQHSFSFYSLWTGEFWDQQVLLFSIFIACVFFHSVFLLTVFRGISARYINHFNVEVITLKDENTDECIETFHIK